jgi:hypothetical protein
MPESSDNGKRPERHAKGGKSAPPWRSTLDAFERPLARASESWIQSGTFMDGFALTWKLQRRLQSEVRRGLEVWFGAWRVPTRGDVDRLSNQIAALERQVRELRGELEKEASPPLGLGSTQRRRPASRDR